MMAIKNNGASFFQFLCIFGLFKIRARDLYLIVQKDGSKTAHADSADSDKMNLLILILF